jgi:hypothetical protein
MLKEQCIKILEDNKVPLTKLEKRMTQDRLDSHIRKKKNRAEWIAKILI